jgi:hypothetical protein
VVPFMHATTSALAKAIPHAQQRTLEGQTHDVNLEVLAPVLVAFFSPKKGKMALGSGARPASSHLRRRQYL